MRFFVGLELNEEMREKIAEFQETLRVEFPKVHWLEKEQLFLVIKFLGYVQRSKMKQVKQTLKRAASQVAPFEIALASPGCFPAEGNARSVWVGITTNSDMLQRFNADCEREFEKIGIPKEQKQFIPHIVLGRSEMNTTKGRLRKTVEAGSVESCEQAANQACLVQSKLKKAGPEYEVLERAPFAAMVVS